MTKRVAYSCSLLCVVHLAVLVARARSAGGAEWHYLLLVGVCAASTLTLLVRRARRDASVGLLAALVTALAPAMGVSLLALAEIAARPGEVGAPLWSYTADLRPIADGLALALRSSAALAALSATFTLTLRGHRAAPLAYGLAVLCVCLASEESGWCLAPIAPLVFVRDAEVGWSAAAALVLGAFGDHMGTWALSLELLDASGPLASASELLEIGATAASPPLPVLLVLPVSSWPLYRAARSRSAGAAAALCVVCFRAVLLVPNALHRALVAVSAATTSPRPRTELRSGSPVVGGAFDTSSCAWVPHETSTIADARRLGCDTVLAIGAGPTMRWHERLAGMGAAFDLPRERSVVAIPFSIIDREETLRVQRELRVEADARVLVILDGARTVEVRPGRALRLRVPADLPAARALEWVDRLGVHQVDVGFAIEPD